MSKIDGSLSLGGKVTPFMEVMLRRRSYRKYADDPAPEDAVSYVLRCARTFQERCGFTAPRISVLPRGPEFDRVVRAATTGLVGMVNPWLGSTKASHMMLCAVVYPEDHHALHLCIEQAAMTMQVALLAAAEVGCGTCWMAGINFDRIEDAHRLEDGARLIAMSPLGRPPARSGLSWDTLMHHVTSKRRKPLEELYMLEVWR